MSYTGQCSCGAVQLTITGKPSLVAECWCKKCQRYAGGTSTVNALFDDDEVVVTGALRWHSYAADNGNIVETAFCPDCGTHVVARTSGRTGCTILRLGVLNEPHDVVPTFKAFVEEAPVWPGFENAPVAVQSARIL